MTYLGNSPADRFVASKAASVFSGDGSTTAFTLDHSVGSDEDILVSVDGVIQEPSVAYSVSGTTLTFTAAPSSNAGNNIFVYYLFRTVGTVSHPSSNALEATSGTFTSDLTVDTNTLYVDSANNRVGVGTTSPDFALDVASEIGIAEGNALAWHDGSGGRAFDMFASGADNSLRFRVTGSSEAMRIDSSGNLLVGTTSTAITTVGIKAKTGGLLQVVRDGEYPLQISRLTSDGEILRFSKSSTTVGSIGTVGGDLIIGTGDTGLFFNDSTNQIHPYNIGSLSGGSVDGAIDLGQSGVRWKDIYLSGGVYLGGTGSANLLDDYEEGTFTPAYELSTTNFDSITHDIQNGKYTKIGNVVYCYLSLRTDSITVGSGAGNVIITGLPFLPSVNVASPQIGRYHNWNTVPNAIRTQTSSATLLLVEENGTGSLGSGVMQTGTNDNLIDITFFYYTNA